jgi:ATPase subunit of ABC transporter with duplicated ATPase domains
MIADIKITEKSFGPKLLMSGVSFGVDAGEKIGIIGRNGVGKSTLFGILNGSDKDYSGEIIFKRGTVAVATSQEHHDMGDITVLQYVLAGLPEYKNLSHIIETYPETMGDNMKLINEYSDALSRFTDKGFYQIEEQIERELDYFQLPAVAHRTFTSLSGGQKRLVEVVKVMHSDADIALIDEPTNHMDYVAKAQFIEWMKESREAMLVITHDRDVLEQVDRIVELKDGSSVSYKGNYDAYLKQNAVSTGTQMNDFELTEKRIANLKVKVLDYQRLKEKSRNPATIQKFKRLEMTSRQELARLQDVEKPTFWIDKNSVENLNYKVAAQYDKFKAKNIRMNLKDDESRSKHVLISARDLSLGYDKPLFKDINIDLREGESMEIRGRNGAGKTTLIKAILGHVKSSNVVSSIKTFNGEIKLDQHIRIGVYEQEVSPTYFDLNLETAVEKIYLDKKLPISTTKVRSILSDFLFNDNDLKIPVSVLSGGQKARFQIISMLANDPQLLILDEPTNHLDLPSIEELETALKKYSGAVVYVSHDGYFCDAMGGTVLKI